MLLPIGQDNSAWTILASFLLTLLMLRMPQIAIADDETGLRNRKRHKLGFQFGIKVLMTGRNLRLGDLLQIGLAQLACGENLAGAASQSPVLLGRHENQPFAATVGDEQRLAQSGVLIAANIPLKL